MIVGLLTLGFISIFFVIGSILLLDSLATLRVYLKARGIETEHIADVSTGPVELTGTPEPIDEPLRAPFTGDDSLLYDVKIERHIPDNDKPNWESIGSAEERIPFELNDDSGSITVDPADASAKLTETYQLKVTGDKAPPNGVDENGSDVLVEVDGNEVYLEDVNWDPKETYQFTERRLTPADTASVLGVARYDSDGHTEPTIDAAARRGRLFGVLPDQPFIVADRDAGAIRSGLAANGVIGMIAGLFFMGVSSLMGLTILLKML